MFREDVGPDLFKQRYSIGVWFWEVSRFPRELHAAFDLVDEVWVGSEFVRTAIAAETTKPVHVVPIPVGEMAPTTLGRSDLELPEGFLFLFSFDFLSIFERKNPLAVVDAFKRAFAPAEGPVLVIKSINGDRDAPSLERLLLATDDRPDIYISDGYISAERKDGLIAACDCYVSLHRSEGYGLTMAEAMACGKPVIATAYSGNLAFMNDENGYLVPFALTTIPSGCGPYPPGAEWAEPDIRTAAEFMRRVYAYQTDAAEIGRRAQADLAAFHSREKTGQFISRRLAASRKRRSSWAGRTTSRAARPPVRHRWEPQQDPGAALLRRARFGGFASIGRRFLRRALWPYLAEQHSLNTRHVQAIMGLESALLRLDEELYASPYMYDPAAFLTHDPEGRPTLGYADEGAVSQGARVYRAFEDVFRGSEQLVRDRQRWYLDLVLGHEPVVDIGCGRGEFLELLEDAGIWATGVDRDAAMVDRCREKGLSVEEAEAIAFLEKQADDSIGVVFSAQVIEHLPYDALLRFFTLAERKLTRGGLFIAETVNPHSLRAFKMFWIDPTHKAPIYPEVSVALCRFSGFAAAYVVFPNGTGELSEDRRQQGEYAVVAMKADRRSTRGFST